MPGLLLALLGGAALLAVLGPRLLRTCGRAQVAAPRFGLLLWILTTTSWAVAVLSAGLAAMAQLTDGRGLAALLHACLRAVATLLAPHDLAEATASLALLGSVLFAARVGMVAVRHGQRTRRDRRAHRHAVCAASGGSAHHRHGITVVDSDAPAAYCVPGHEHAIVLTTGALRRLSGGELRAVLGHEAAHLRGRHALWVGWVTVLADAFRFVPLLRAAPAEVARLVEWIADDRAGRRHGDRVVAHALAVMATGRATGETGAAAGSAAEAGKGAGASVAPDVALTAAGSDVTERVRRLLRRQPAARFAYGRGIAVLSLSLVALLTAAAVLLPAATADPGPFCTASPSLEQLGQVGRLWRHG